MKWSPVDIVIVIIAGTLSIIQISVILGALISGKPMSEKGAEVMGDLTLAQVAIISLYIGTKIKGS